MIKKLNKDIICDSEYPFTKEEVLNKINEIIDWLNKADPSNYYVDMSMKIDNEQIEKDKIDAEIIEEVFDKRTKRELNEMQNGFVEEKSWQKKYEELNKILKDERTLYCARHYDDGRLHENIDIIPLIKQVISELIKDNERLRYNENLYKEKWKHVARQLQQKQPPKECIEWLESIINRKEFFGSGYHCVKKLLKYFKEIK